MRPRSFDRGNDTDRAVLSAPGIASMRPRSFDRGNQCIKSVALRRIFRSRKLAEGPRRGFNEAAVGSLQ